MNPSISEQSGALPTHSFLRSLVLAHGSPTSQLLDFARAGAKSHDSASRESHYFTAAAANIIIGVKVLVFRDWVK